MAPTFKEVTYTGKPGNICVVVNSDQRFNGFPTRGLAWGKFDEHGNFGLLVDAARYPIIVAHEYDPSPELVAKLERSWHVNTA